jgi:hypothetical protein
MGRCEVTQDQWRRIKSEIEDAEAENVSDAVSAAEARAREKAEAATQEGIVDVLRDLRSNYEDGSPEAAALDLAVDAAERWTP